MDNTSLLALQGILGLACVVPGYLHSNSDSLRGLLHLDPGQTTGGTQQGPGNKTEYGPGEHILRPPGHSGLHRGRDVYY